MADESTKKLLVKLGISTKEWQSAVVDIKKKLKDIQTQSMKDAQDRLKNQKTELAGTKLQIEEQKRLRAEALAMAAVDKAKTQWQEKQNAALKAGVLVSKQATEAAKAELAQVALKEKSVREVLKTEQAHLKVTQQQTQEQEKQRRLAANTPNTQNIAGLRSKVQGAISPTTISAIQTEVLQKEIAQERAKLLVQESQLRVLSQQEGTRKVDVEVVQKELAQERAKLVLLEQQLRIRLQQENELAQEERRKAGLPTAGGVAGIRALTTEATAVQLSKEQAAVLEKHIVEERVKLSVQESQLRVLKLAGDVRKADVAVLEKEIAQERARLAVQEAQVRASRVHMGAGGGGHEGGGGFLGGALMSLGGGLFGAGLAGPMAAGVTAGLLLEKTLEKLGEVVRETGHELMNAAGQAGQLEEQFIKLARRDGTDPEELMHRLTIATRGLVEQEQLFRVANNFMSGSLKLSSDEMVHLTQMTLDLSRATGKDATQAMTALIRSSLTGQTRMLAMVTGIDRAQLSVKGLSAATDPLVRKQLELHTVMDAMQRKLSEVGTPMTTVQDLFRQVHVLQTTFIEDMAFSITHSDSFSKAIERVSKWLMAVTPSLLDFAGSVGDKIGSAFESIQPILGEFWSILTSIWLVVKSLTSALNDLGEALSSLGGKAEGARGKFSIISTAIHLLTAALAPGTFAIKEFSLAVVLLLKTFDALKNKSIEQATAALRDFSEETRKAKKELNEGLFGNPFERMHERQERKFGSRSHIGTAGQSVPRPNQDQSILKGREKLAQEIAQAQAKIRLNARLAELEEESNVEKEKYDMGLETLRAYVDKEKTIRSDQHKARLDEIQQELDAKTQALNLEARGQNDPLTGKMVGGMDPEQLRQKKELAGLQSQEKIDAENRRYKSEDHALDKQMLEDEIAARRTFVEAINRITQEGVAERKKLNEQEFTDGAIGANEYISTQKTLIQQEYDLRVQSLNQEADANKKNAAELAKIRVQLVEAVIKKEKELMELEDKESQLRLEDIQRRYQAAESIAQIDVGVGRARGDTGQTIVGLQTQQDLTTRYLQQLQAERQRLEQTGQRFTKEWVDVNVQIGKAVEQQIKLNQEIAQAKDWAGPLGKIFGTISSELSGVLGSGATSVLQSITKSMEGISAVIKARAAAGTTQTKGTWESFKDLFRPVEVATERAKSAMEIFNDGLKSSEEKVKDFVGGLGSSVDGLSKGMGDAQQVFTGAVDTSAQQLKSLADAAAQAAAKLLQIQPPQLPVQKPGITVDGGEAPQVPLEPGSDVGNQIPTPDSSGGGGDAGGGLFSAMMSMVTDQVKQFGNTVQESGTKGVQSFSDKLGSVMGKAQALIGSVMNTASAIMGAKSTMGGIMQGGMAGAQTGMMIGGPIGAAIGATFGAVMGGLMGHKAAQAAKEAEEIKTKLDAIKSNVTNGSMTIGDAIQTLKSTVAPRIASMEHGSKAEQAQAQELQKKYVEELTQLLTQQKQLMDQLVQELGVLMAPTAYQQIMQSLEGIIAKYKQFASAAAGDTAKVAMAQDWLKRSLEQYAVTLQDKVNSANEQAIQDALHLNDLLQQRQDILNAAAQQEYDIMTRGVMQRQMSPAQTKMQEMGAVEIGKNKQLSAIDEETKITKYKVDAESKIFGLAKSRVGLEQQMLALQEHSVDKQMGEIQAMMQAIAKLDAAIQNGLPKSLIDALGGVDVNALAELLGIPIPGIGPGGKGKPYIENIPAIYQEMLSVMESVPGYSDYEKTLISIGQTPMGSGQRKAAEDSFLHNSKFWWALVNAGLVDRHHGHDDPNWFGFANWMMYGLKSVTPEQTQGFLKGGPVKQTGQALVHAGEWVVPEASVMPIRKFLRWATDNPDEVRSPEIQDWLVPPTGVGGGPEGPPTRKKWGPKPEREGSWWDLHREDPELLGPPVHKKWGKKTEREGSWWDLHREDPGPVGPPTPRPRPWPVPPPVIPPIIPLGGGPSAGARPAQPGIMADPWTSAVGNHVLATRLNHETQVFSLAHSRVAMEMDLIMAQSRFAAIEMQRLDATRKLYEEMQNGGIGITSLEGAFAKLYELRGRYGSAGFNKEQL